MVVITAVRASLYLIHPHRAVCIDVAAVSGDCPRDDTGKDRGVVLNTGTSCHQRVECVVESFTAALTEAVELEMIADNT